jgi:type VI secretion system protein VasD
MTLRAARAGRFVALALLLLVARCAAPPPPPATLALEIACGPGTNPDPSGQPLPVAIRLFQLNASAKFERADVFALTERERATLGEDDAGSEEVVLRPGETRTLDRELKKGVQFVGVAVLFRDIDRATWRAVQPVTSSGPNRLKLTVDGTTATLAPPPAPKS